MIALKQQFEEVQKDRSMLPLPAAHASDMLEWGILDCGPHGRVGDTGGGVMGSNTGLAVAAGTVSVPYSGLGRPSLGRYSHDRA